MLSLRYIGDCLAERKNDLLQLWKETVRQHPGYGAVRTGLSDEQLLDHVPKLLNQLISALREEELDSLEQASRDHGRQRRQMGYSVPDVLWELSQFRHLALETIESAGFDKIERLEMQRSRQLVLDLLDQSARASVDQFTIEAEQERRIAELETRRLNEQRDRFLATLSHELRNHVAPILMSVQVLNQTNLADQRQVRAVEIIERQARHQSMLIDDLLDVSRVERGTVQLRKHAFDLRETVKHAIETCTPQISSKSLRLSVNLGSGPLSVDADPARISQVMTNLLSNAARYTEPGGSVELVLRREADNAIFSVKDTGIGIAPDVLPRVFEMFFQANVSPERTTAGLGLGLSLAKSLVQMHGGTIEAHSEGIGKGAEFTISLRLAKRSEQAVRRGSSVLLVENDPDLREAMQDALMLMDFEVLAASNGEEALEIARKSSPASCVIDLALPKMNGYELGTRLRQLHSMKDAVLVAVSGYAGAEDISRALEFGFSEVLTKPLDLNRLLRILSPPHFPPSDSSR